jgi:hypothetical protein
MKTIRELFPYFGHPYKLKHKDGKDTKTCYFQCEEHMKKHIVRYNLRKKDYTIDILNKNEKNTCD